MKKSGNIDMLNHRRVFLKHEKNYFYVFFKKYQCFIDVFKGVNLNNKEVPHYIETALRAHIYTTQYNHSLDRIADKNELKYPHQIGQIILNGSRFFEFVAHYIEQQKYLEKHTELAPYLKSYNGSHRAGDNYARNLFLAVVMLYHDKFKEQHFKQAIRLCFCWAYKLRVENSRVLMASIDNYAKNIFEQFKKILF